MMLAPHRMLARNPFACYHMLNVLDGRRGNRAAKGCSQTSGKISLAPSRASAFVVMI